MPTFNFSLLFFMPLKVHSDLVSFIPINISCSNYFYLGISISLCFFLCTLPRETGLSCNNSVSLLGSEESRQFRKLHGPLLEMDMYKFLHSLHAKLQITELLLALD